MSVVTSDDIVTIEGIDVRIPYANEKQLTKSQEHWLEDHCIEYVILDKPRATLDIYDEVIRLPNS